jgi:hypothetical protein
VKEDTHNRPRLCLVIAPSPPEAKLPDWPAALVSGEVDENGQDSCRLE